MLPRKIPVSLVLATFVSLGLLFPKTISARAGDRDNGFGQNGIVVIEHANDPCQTLGGNVHLAYRRGKILVATSGMCGVQTEERNDDFPALLLYQLQADGSLDPSFDRNGKKALSQMITINALKFQNDGKILLASPEGLLRLNTDV